ncbi:hypothetical protein [Streptomyces hokutonensis]|uniref:hypothetical protein n=1 Tax=Streptomyces hokutonensis TaxID=1306990 RepID=UPI001319F5E6|nr:hypothetical protein [Streptomyces hokutonensis]
MALDVIANASVLQFLPLGTLYGKASGSGHSAGRRMVDPVAQLQPEQSDLVENPATSYWQARDATALAPADSAVPHDTQPVRWRRFTMLTATLPNTMSSVSTTAKRRQYLLPTDRLESRAIGQLSPATRSAR